MSSAATNTSWPVRLFWAGTIALFSYLIWDYQQRPDGPVWRLNGACEPVDAAARRVLARQGTAFWQEQLGIIDKVMAYPSGLRRAHAAVDGYRVELREQRASRSTNTELQQGVRPRTLYDSAEALRKSADAVEEEAARSRRLAEVLRDSAAFAACRASVIARISSPGER